MQNAPNTYLSLFQEVSAGIVVLLGLILGGWKFIKANPKKTDFISLHTEIHEMLTELRINTKAMRTSVMGYHNGEYFANGVSMHKFTMSHESIHKGYTSQGTKMRNVLCSLCIPLINQVLLDAAVMYHVDDLPVSYVKEFFEDENVSHYAVLSLRDKGVQIGFILIQWHKDFAPPLPEQEHLLHDFVSIRDSVALNLQYQKKA